MVANKAKNFVLVNLFATGLGLLGGVLTFAFIRSLQSVISFLWETVPNALSADMFVYTVVLCTIGGVLVALSNKYLGNYPKEMFASIQEFKSTGSFDYKHIPQSILASFASLGFGASLGPEAALIAVVGGVSSWVSKKIKAASANAKAIVDAGVSSSVGALFGAPLAGAAVAVGKTKPKKRDWHVLIPSLLAALVGYGFIKYVMGGNGGYFNYAFPAYRFALTDLLYAIPVAAVAVVPGLLFFSSEPLLKSFFSRFSKTWQPIISGTIFGLLAGTSGLLLFSGHEGIQEIISEESTLTAGFLITISLAKAFAASLLLATGWKGGRFFPLMFSGAALGLAVTLIFTGIPTMVGLATAMAATLAAVIRRPLIVMLLLAFIFTPNLYVFVILGTLLGNALSQRIAK